MVHNYACNLIDTARYRGLGVIQAAFGSADASLSLFRIGRSQLRLLSYAFRGMLKGVGDLSVARKGMVRVCRVWVGWPFSALRVGCGVWGNAIPGLVDLV